MKLAAASSMHYFCVGELTDGLATAERGRALYVEADGPLGDWLAGLDGVAMYCHTFLGTFASARRLSKVVSVGPWARPADHDVLCPSVISQVALAEGELHEAKVLAENALASARRLGFEGHYFTFCATRTMALLAWERRHLALASELVERALEIVSHGRPMFAYLAQLDRARIWAAEGSREDALASLPAARAALRSARSPLLAKADELEARLRLALGDVRGAEHVASRLPEERRRVVSAIIALAAGDHLATSEQLHDAPAGGATIRSDLELRAPRAEIAVIQSAPRAPQLLRGSLDLAERWGFVQTVLDTAPRVVDHLVAGSNSYPAGPTLSTLVAARLEERKFTVAFPRRAA